MSSRVLVRGHGLSTSRLMAVGEAPGPQEHVRRRPFVGVSGFILNSSLEAAGLSRGQLWISNVYPYFLGRDKKGKIINPTPEQIAEEEGYILEELIQRDPTHVLALGDRAISWFLERDDLDVARVNGLTFDANKAGIDFRVTCAYHPAAGLYDPNAAGRHWMAVQMFGHSVAGKITQGHKTRVPKVKREEEYHITTRSPAIDTETLVTGKVHCITLAHHKSDATIMFPVHKGRVLRVSGRPTFHYAAADLKPLAKLGVKIERVDCTMQMAYVLQTEPRGLKDLAYRWLNWDMQDYNDVVGPHHRKAALGYLNDAIEMEWPKPVPIEKPDGRMSRPHSIPTRLKSLRKSIIAPKPKAKPVHQKWIMLPPEMRRTIRQQCGKFPAYDLRVVPKDEADNYAAIDPAATIGIKPILTQRLKEQGLWDVYRLDRSVLPMFARMEMLGMPFDVAYSARLSGQLQEEGAKAAAAIRKIARDPKLNPASPPQLAELIYQEWGLPVGRLTQSKTAASTDDKALRMLVQKWGKKYPQIVPLQKAIDDFRECQKYDSTFVVPFLRAVGDDGRMRFTIKPATVFTGRISTEDPNILSTPTRTARGILVKNQFRAPDGFYLLSVDLSQMELRTAAHLSRDKVMCKAFQQEQDLHIVTTAKMFGASYKDVLEGYKAGDQKMTEQRYTSKTINFAVLYGITGYALYEQLIIAGITAYSVDDCEQIIADWFKLYGGVKKFLEETYAFGRRTGYVEAMGGRRRYVPLLALGRNDITAKTIAAAEREAGNHPVQGTASGFILKRAQRATWRWLRSGAVEARGVDALLQFHDELIFQVPCKKAPRVAEIVKGFMTADQKLFRVPLKADAGWAERWGDA